MDLRIVTYNCRSIKSSLSRVQKLCLDHDVILLQETWLYSHNLDFIHSVHKDFYAGGCSSIDSSQQVITGRPYGGLAILWRHAIAESVVFKYFSNRIVGVELDKGGHKVLILNVYLPYDDNTQDGLEEYIHHLGVINSIVQDASTSEVLVLGDYNADFGKRFGQELQDFAADHMLVVSDKVMCDNDSFYTYLSESHNTTSWLDHVLCTGTSHNNIRSCNALHDVAFSDHIPLSVKYSMPVDCNVSHGSPNVSQGSKTREGDCYTKWADASVAQQQLYNSITDTLLSEIKVDSEALSCSNTKCTDISHSLKLNSLYQDIQSVLKKASMEAVGTKKGGNFRVIAGWSDLVETQHNQARDAYLEWRAAGKPRQGSAFEDMKSSRARFKYAFRECVRNQETLKANAMASSLQQKDYVGFWKKVCQMNNSKIPTSNTVNGVSGPAEIADMWRTHYADLFNSVDNIKYKEQVMSYVRATDNSVPVSVHNIVEILSKLKKGKAPGLDDLHAEHFIYASKKLCVLLSLLVSSIFSHGYFPAGIKDTVLLPLIKNKAGDVTDLNNYRPIAVSNCITKIIELIIFDRIEGLLVTTDNQFGFKSKHSTDMCVCISSKYILQ